MPVRILDTLLAPLLVTNKVAQDTGQDVSLPPIAKVTDYHLLPQLNIRLSHRWFQHVTTTQQPVKRDDAAIDNSVWDKRITLVFPSLHPRHLDSFRQWSKCYLNRQLYLEFKQYLAQTYPLLWGKYLKFRNPLNREFFRGVVVVMFLILIRVEGSGN